VRRSTAAAPRRGHGHRRRERPGRRRRIRRPRRRGGRGWIDGHGRRDGRRRQRWVGVARSSRAASARR
jgi:hypothetical protein